MEFGTVLELLRQGERVCRAGWNGRGMFIFLVPGSEFTVEADRPLGRANAKLVGSKIQYQPHIDFKTVDGAVVPWCPSQTDLLASDWMLAE